ncbi:extracellular solute-binding protein [Paenibacillus koleovorans]|uniref:extracellular solute-binding protein n=1 Tax=Paenibacillus koleovorans TaxID=121608 RepID=UPI000FDA887D|nr:extracellular solute-binding protein [Paenibacillus koleovorans]
MKKITALSLVIAASMGVSTACSDKEKTTGQGATATVTPSTSTSTPSTSLAKIPLKLFISANNASASLPQNPADDFVKKAIEEKFNVTLDVNYMLPGTDYTNKINAMIAGNDAPDFWRDSNGDGGNKYALTGILADMTPYVSPSTMPNYFKYWITQEELKLYQIQNQFIRIPLAYDKNVYRSYYIRKDWLDKLGLKVPSSYDEYFKVLKAFTENDPDGNGKKDTYGFTTAGGGTSLSLDWPEWIKNGLTYPSFAENNKYIDMQTDARVQQVVDDIVKVIGEGVIDPDWFLNKAANVLDKAVPGRVGVVIGNTKDFAYDSMSQSLQSKSKAINPNANWVAFNPLGNVALRTAPSAGSPILFSKSAAEKNPEKLKRAVMVLDWLAGEEGYLLTHYGVEGKHYTRKGNVITLNIEARDTDITKKGDFLEIWNFFAPYTPEVFGLQVIDPRESDRDRELYKFITSIPVRPNVGAGLAPPEGVDLGAFRARQNELHVKMVLEEKSGKNWPIYREEVLNKYKGKLIFDAYETQMRAAGLIK